MSLAAQKEYFDSLLGKIISNRYRLDAKIGAGAMGAVFQAVNLENAQLMAIKVIAPELVTDEKFIKRFEREADLGKLLNHPNIVRVEEFGQTENKLFFIAMEFVPGETLKTHLTKSGVLSPQRALELLTPLCAALDFAHNHNVLHRDLKPDNVLVAKNFSKKEVIKLADFGIAKRTDLSKTKDQMLTIEGEIFGTPHYMSPEQVLAQKLKPTTDVYSVGVILYQMLSGKLPIEHPRAQQLLVLKVSQDIAPISRTHNFISPLFDPIFQKVLTRSPSERYQSAGELLNDVKSVILKLNSSFNTVEKNTVEKKSSSPEKISLEQVEPSLRTVTNISSSINTTGKLLAEQSLKVEAKHPRVESKPIFPKSSNSVSSIPVKSTRKLTNNKNAPLKKATNDQTMLVVGMIGGLLLVFLLAFWLFFFR